MTNAGDIEKIDAMINNAAGTFLVGDASLDRLRGIGLAAMEDSPSALCAPGVAGAAIAAEMEGLKEADVLAQRWLARWAAKS